MDCSIMHLGLRANHQLTSPSHLAQSNNTLTTTSCHMKTPVYIVKENGIPLCECATEENADKIVNALEWAQSESTLGEEEYGLYTIETSHETTT